MDIFSSINSIRTKTDANVDYTPKTHSKTVTEIQKANEHIEEKKSKDEIKKELQKVITELNKAMNPLNTALKFKFNDKIDELTVQVIDKKTNEVIREFPPKEALRLMEKMRELVGMLFDKKG
jgi:flagellar protein FlaG